MNILMMISKNDKYGAQRVFLDQVSALHRMGSHIVVVGRGNEGFVTESVRAMGVEYYGIPMKGVKDVFFLMKLVKKYNIQVIHTALDRADYLGLLVARVTRRPIVSTMNVKRYHIGYKLVDKVVVVSRQQQGLLTNKGVHADRIRLIRPGIDVDRFSHPHEQKRDSWKQKLKTDSYGIVFCHISSLLPQKKHFVSIELMAEIRKRGEKPLLIIAGDPLRGEYYESLVKKIADSGLEQNVYFTGWTSELPELLSLSHFTILPSVHEAFGMVLVEGMAAGNPIIARKGEGGAELIQQYGTGFLYSKEEGVGNLADEIISLLHDSGRYSALSNRCRRIARDELSLGRFGEQLAQVYQSLS